MGVMALFIINFLISVSGAASRAQWPQDGSQAQLQRRFSKARRGDSQLQVGTTTGCFFWEPDCKDSSVLCGPNAILYEKVADNQCHKFIYLWNYAESECSGPGHDQDGFRTCFWAEVNKWVPAREHCPLVCADSHGSIADKVQNCQLQCDHVFDCKDRCEKKEYKFKDSISMCLSECMETSAASPEGTCNGSCNKQSPNMKCHCDPTCMFMNDCCKDYENYCLVASAQPGQKIGDPKPPKFNVSDKDIKSFRGKYATKAEPAPPVPKKYLQGKPAANATENATATPAPDAAAAPASDATTIPLPTVDAAPAPAGGSSAAFLQRQSIPYFDKIVDLLEPKVEEMAKRIKQDFGFIEDPRKAKFLQTLEIFLGDKRSNSTKGNSKPHAKIRVDTLVKNLVAVKKEGEMQQKGKSQQAKVHQDPLPPPPPLDAVPEVPGAPAAAEEAAENAEAIHEEGAKLGEAVGEINNDVNDMFHLLEEAEYWNHKAPMLKSAVFDFASHYQASLHNLAIVSGLIAGGPAGAPGAPGAPGAAPAGHAPAR